MKNKFVKHIENLFTKEDKLILSISGGADSVALALLLFGNGFNFSFAHCNFNLRGKESDGDEKFVVDLSKQLNINCEIKHFDTEKYALENSISIQMAARDLRYNWFENLRKKTNSDYILVAHHSDDDKETFFINLIRGSGMRGFLGMKEKKNKIIRPLLSFSRKEIEEYLHQKNQSFRTDSSNVDTKYLRNNIRHHLLPLIYDMNPSFGKTIEMEMKYLNEVFDVFSEVIDKRKSEIVSSYKDGISIDIGKLLKDKNDNILMHEILSPYGFSETEKVLKSAKGESGKVFYSETHKLLIDREKIFVSKRKKSEVEKIFIEKEESKINFPLKLAFSISENTNVIPNENIAKIDFEKLTFPLTLRKWKEGDYFYPLGMNGKKKLSDFFIDNKLSLFEKEDIWILCSDQKVVWIVGSRIDDRFKITENSKKAYIAELF